MFTSEQKSEIRADLQRLSQVAAAKKWGVCRETLLCAASEEYRKKVNARSNAWSRSHAEKRCAIGKAWRENNRARHLAISAKSRARQQGLAFNISHTDIVIPEMCPVLGIRLIVASGKGKPQPGSMSLDRIDPTEGYIKGNVRVISFRANTLKSDATVSELELVLQDLKGLPC